MEYMEYAKLMELVRAAQRARPDDWKYQTGLADAAARVTNRIEATHIAAGSRQMILARSKTPAVLMPRDPVIRDEHPQHVVWQTEGLVVFITTGNPDDPAMDARVDPLLSEEVVQRLFREKLIREDEYSPNMLF